MKTQRAEESLAILFWYIDVPRRASNLAPIVHTGKKELWLITLKDEYWCKPSGIAQSCYNRKTCLIKRSRLKQLDKSYVIDQIHRSKYWKLVLKTKFKRSKKIQIYYPFAWHIKFVSNQIVAAATWKRSVKKQHKKRNNKLNLSWNSRKISQLAPNQTMTLQITTIDWGTYQLNYEDMCDQCLWGTYVTFHRTMSKPRAVRVTHRQYWTESKSRTKHFYAKWLNKSVRNTSITFHQ